MRLLVLLLLTSCGNYQISNMYWNIPRIHDEEVAYENSVTKCLKEKTCKSTWDRKLGMYVITYPKPKE